MNTLRKVHTPTGTVTCAEIGRLNGELFRQLLAFRTSIWTCKYHKKAGRDGLEQDEYDTNSSYIALFEGGGPSSTVIGGCRIIHTEAGELPVNEYSSVPIIGRAVEISRFFFSPGNEVAKAESVSRFQCLLGGLITFLTREGYDRAYATIRASFFEKLRAEFNLPIVRIGTAQRDDCGAFVPAMVFHTEALSERSYVDTRSPAKAAYA